MRWRGLEVLGEHILLVTSESSCGCEFDLEYFGELEKRRFLRENREDEGGISVGGWRRMERGLSARANDGLVLRMPSCTRDGDCQVIHIVTRHKSG